jgi:alpha-mannosidase
MPFKYVLENNLVKIAFDTTDASIMSMVNKDTGEEMVDGKSKAGIFRLVEEDDEALGMTAWIVGKYMNIENLHKNAKIKMNPGKLRNSLHYTMEFRNSKLEVKVWLDENSRFLNFDVICNWCEIGKPHRNVPQLDFYIPTAFNCKTYKYDVPFGVVEREGRDMDVPANSWAASVRSEKSKKDLMLVTDSKHGFRNVDNSMSITLIRSSYDPDPYPEFGVHKFKFAIGSVDCTSTNRNLINRAYDFNHPLSVLSGKAHKGTFGLSGTFISVMEGSIAVSAVKMPEEDPENRILVRIYETDGNVTKAVLKLFKNLKSAYPVDINEEKTENAGMNINIDGDMVTVEVLPYHIVNLILEI